MKRFFTIISCLLGFFASAQPLADFKGSVLQGCAQLNVAFTDLSTGNPKYWNWDFGNGQLSDKQNPTAVYSVPGIYSVTLVVRNDDGTNAKTYTDYITVFPSPQAKFTTDFTVGCSPVTVHFTDQSTSSSGTIVKWAWDLGSGVTDNTPSPTHTYTDPGYVTVSLTVTSSNGCTNRSTANRLIRVVEGIKVDFSNELSTTCKPPYNIPFKNETSGPGTLNYTWNLGNGTTTNQEDPTATYNTAGTFNVTLKAESNLGCKDSAQKSVTVNPYTSSFTINSADTVCPNQGITFTNTSNPRPTTFTWNFGDGTSIGAQQPVKSYTALGTYVVQLLNDFTNCKDTALKTITVSNHVVTDFTATNNKGCKAPLTVQFDCPTPGVSTYNWDFGDGSVGVGKNPTHTYLAPGNYAVKLSIITVGGCDATISKPAFVQIAPGNLFITNTPVGGCVPFDFSPQALSTTPDPIASYSWDFGDGGTSTASNPTHHYTTTGQFDIKLTATTSGGCTMTTIVPKGVQVGNPPGNVDFTTTNPNPCTSAALQFQDLTTPAATQWVWDFGDGTPFVGEQNPLHNFADTGTFTVTLFAKNNGCGKKVTKTNYIHVLAPLARFTKAVANCANPLSINFTNTSKVDPALGAVSYFWEFGDPLNNTASGVNATFTYPDTGVYLVKLTVTNGSCSHTYTDSVLAYLPRADFSISKSAVCKFEKFILKATGDTSKLSSYTWSFNGGPPVSKPYQFDTSFAPVGTYSITLDVVDKNGCPGTTTVNNAVTVSGPTAKFAPAGNGGCANTTVQFNDSSTSSVGIKQWLWNFGDNNTLTTFTAPPFSHQYTTLGVYAPGLTVVDIAGCTDTATSRIPIRITKPVAGFKADKNVFCPGVDFQFIDTSSGTGLTYAWNFGDGNTSTLSNPKNIYVGGNATYTVSLIVKDIVGCSDTTTVPNFVQILKPKAAFTYQDTSSICNLLETQFFFGGSDYNSFYWDFGDSSQSISKNPLHFYNSFGQFTATLYVVGNGGCYDSAQRVVNLYNPNTSTQVVYSPLNACNRLTVDFNITTPPQTTFNFFYGDGTIDSSQIKVLQHLYDLPGFYSPIILLKDKYDCQAAVGGTSGRIVILGAVPLFNIDNKKFCDTGNVFITNYTIANDPVVSNVWDMGDGTQYTVKTPPKHSYNLSGTYPVTLTVTTQAGCTRSFTDTVRVYKTPEPSIVAPDEICVNGNTAFNGLLSQPDTAITWGWDFGDGRNSPFQNNLISYNKVGNYTVNLQAVNLLGCKGTDTKPLIVHANPTVQTKNVTIPLKGSITLPVSYSPGISTYTWTPPAGLSCTGCAIPIATPAATTTYNIAVVDSNSCTANANLTVSVLCAASNYFVPNTFSPNGDGMNDVFYPRGNALTRVAHMQIFSRWGQLIFERKDFVANDPSMGWDGKVNGQLAPPDVYVYIVDFICENSQIVPYKGNVALIR